MLTYYPVTRFYKHGVDQKWEYAGHWDQSQKEETAQWFLTMDGP